MLLQFADDPAAYGHEALLVLGKSESSWTFVDVPSEPVPSLLRGFSAPVALDDGLGDTALLTLLAHDTDPFNRWEAGQRLSLRRLLAAVQSGAPPLLDEPYLQALRSVLRDPALDPAFKSMALALPAEAYIAEQLEAVDPQRIHAVREAMVDQLAEHLHADWAWAFEQHQVHGGYAPQRAQAGQRALAARALAMLCRHAARSGNPVWPGRAYQQLKDAGNMSERLAALNALVNSRAELADAALQRFHAQAQGNALVIDKWFDVQARASEDPAGSGAVLARAKALLQHPDFSLRNPNRVRALLVSLCRDNPAAFHRADASGYVFWADRLLELDAVNPSVAGRLARVMDRWTHLAEPYRSAAREAIARVAARSELSNEVREIVQSALEAA
jgi:aminopeptidase N